MGNEPEKRTDEKAEMGDACAGCRHHSTFHTAEGDCMGPGCFCEGYTAVGAVGETGQP